MNIWRRSKQTGAFTLAVAMSVSVAVAAQQKDDKDAKDKGSDKKPKLTLKAQPVISMSPAKVTLRAELVGGANDYEEYYCPTVEWDWGDGTQSESTADCEPYEAGKSEIKRRFTVEHVFRDRLLPGGLPPEAPRQGGGLGDDRDSGAGRRRLRAVSGRSPNTTDSLR